MKVLIIDDHAPERYGLRGWLEDEWLIVRDVGTTTEAIDLLKKWQPDIIILDMVMRDPHTAELNHDEPLGLTTAVYLTQKYPHIHLLVHTSYYTYLSRTLAIVSQSTAGFGYLLKTDTPASEFIAILRRVAAGEVYIDPEARQLSTQQAQGLVNPESMFTAVVTAAKQYHKLTQAEHEVTELVAHGLSNSQIQDTRNTTSDTVQQQLRHAYRKLGLTDVGGKRVVLALTYWYVQNAQNSAEK
ncbi:MAG: response regulator transcription factor [Anaerolineales bacterium]|nr:response regulator transcription factor [Anaerolineales bacterium]